MNIENLLKVRDRLKALPDFPLREMPKAYDEERNPNLMAELVRSHPVIGECGCILGEAEVLGAEDLDIEDIESPFYLFCVWGWPSDLREAHAALIARPDAMASEERALMVAAIDRWIEGYNAAVKA